MQAFCLRFVRQRRGATTPALERKRFCSTSCIRSEGEKDSVARASIRVRQGSDLVLIANGPGSPGERLTSLLRLLHHHLIIQPTPLPLSTTQDPVCVLHIAVGAGTTHVRCRGLGAARSAWREVKVGPRSSCRLYAPCDSLAGLLGQHFGEGTCWCFLAPGAVGSATSSGVYGGCGRPAHSERDRFTLRMLSPSARLMCLRGLSLYRTQRTRRFGRRQAPPRQSGGRIGWHYIYSKDSYSSSWGLALGARRHSGPFDRQSGQARRGQVCFRPTQNVI